MRGTVGDREGEAAAALSDARDAFPADSRIRIELPDTAVPWGRTVLDAPGSVVILGEMYDAGAPVTSDSRLVLRDPERVSLTGPNGVGKTTLLNALRPLATVPAGYLRQRIGSGRESWEGLDDALSVVDNVRRGAPEAALASVREQLARFHFRGNLVNQAVGELSGGERFRVALARILLARPAPQLLFLDEPTNNLDLASTEQLVSALGDYEGALIVSSHDDAFLAELAPERRWELRRLNNY
ncbi:ATP-binding cassette domain-containing protein [Arthrobacter livingstonensis]|nr:ATP-binding cassette domain-containing protein [Arthrobacter livingstonensis]